jgi:putative oxidoreductase
MLLLRLWVGVVGVAHGGQKLGFFGGDGIAKFAEGLTKMGVPAPTISAWMAALAESVGGAMIAIGLWPRLAAIPFAITMIVAWSTAHHFKFFGQGGGEYAFTLAVIAIAIIIAGPGRFTVLPATQKGRS